MDKPMPTLGGDGSLVAPPGYAFDCQSGVLEPTVRLVLGNGPFYGHGSAARVPPGPSLAVPVKAVGAVIVDRNGKAIATGYTPELAERIAIIINHHSGVTP